MWKGGRREDSRGASKRGVMQLKIMFMYFYTCNLSFVLETIYDILKRASAENVKML